jgi:hypothetical protein
MKIFQESAEQQATRLSQFQDQTFLILDRYIHTYASPKDYPILFELRKDLWNLKFSLLRQSCGLPPQDS